MNSFVFVALFAAFAAANAGILSGAPLVSTYAASPVVSAYSAPLVGAGLVGEQTVVAGPSGTISTAKTLAAPAVAAYAAPALSAYSAPIVSSYGAPVVSSYGAPVVSSYGAPVVSSYGAPIVSSYSAPGLVARTIW